MKATVPYVQKKFKEFNEQFFSGILPEIPIELSDAKGFLGVCKYRTRETNDGEVELYDFRLSINTRIDLPEPEVEDIIIHEMIHYFIGLNRLEDSSSHGPMFQHLMKSINEKYGRHISITHKGTEDEKEQAYDKRHRWHAVAVVTYFGGRTGVKVLPRIRTRILEFNKEAIKLDGIDHITYYLTNDPFFNRFPNSTSLNIQDTNDTEISSHLVDAIMLTVIQDNVYIP